MRQRKSKHIIRFEKENHRRMMVEVRLNGIGRIIRIDNLYRQPFPFVEGQLLTRDYKAWACERGYLINGETPKCGGPTNQLDESESNYIDSRSAIEKLADKMADKLVTYAQPTIDPHNTGDQVLHIKYSDMLKDTSVPTDVPVPYLWSPEYNMHEVEVCLYKLHKKWLLAILKQYMSLDDELAQVTYDIFDNNIFEYVE